MSEAVTVSAANPPPETQFVWEWERGLDPWHRDAFTGTGVDTGSNGERKGGWFGLDRWGNQITWCPDGTVIAGEPVLSVEIRTEAALKNAA